MSAEFVTGDSSTRSIDDFSLAIPHRRRTSSHASTSTDTCSTSASSPNSAFTSQVPTTPLSELTLSDHEADLSPRTSRLSSHAEHDGEDTPTPEAGAEGAYHSIDSTLLRKLSTAGLIPPHDPNVQPDFDLDQKPPLQSSISAPPGSIVTTSDITFGRDSIDSTASEASLDSISTSSSEEAGPVKGFSFGSCPSAPLEPTSSDDLFLGTPTAEKGQFEYPLFPPGSPTSQASGSSSRRSSVAFGLPPSAHPSAYSYSASSSRRASIAQANHSYFHPSNVSTPNSRKPSLTRRSSSSASTITSYSPDLDPGSSTPGASSSTAQQEHPILLHSQIQTRRPSLHPITVTPMLPLPQHGSASAPIPARRGSILFQTKAGPTPIPPSLLARRGSLPATDKIFGLPSHEKRLNMGGMSAGGNIGGLGNGLGSSRLGGSRTGSGIGCEPPRVGAGRLSAISGETGAGPSSAGFNRNYISPISPLPPTQSLQRRSSIANGQISRLAQSYTSSHQSQEEQSHSHSHSQQHSPYRSAPRKSSLLSSGAISSYPQDIPEVSPPISDQGSADGQPARVRRASGPSTISSAGSHYGSSHYGTPRGHDNGAYHRRQSSVPFPPDQSYTFGSGPNLSSGGGVNRHSHSGVADSRDGTSDQEHKSDHTSLYSIDDRSSQAVPNDPSPQSSPMRQRASAPEYLGGSHQEHEYPSAYPPALQRKGPFGISGNGSGQDSGPSHDDLLSYPERQRQKSRDKGSLVSRGSNSGLSSSEEEEEEENDVEGRRKEGDYHEVPPIFAPAPDTNSLVTQPRPAMMFTDPWAGSR